MLNTRDLEIVVLGIVRDYINSQNKRFAELGLGYEICVERHSSNAMYSSELRVEFSDENGLCDLLEVQVALKGEPVTSVEKVRKWLPDAVADVINRRQGSLR